MHRHLPRRLDIPSPAYLVASFKCFNAFYPTEDFAHDFKSFIQLIPVLTSYLTIRSFYLLKQLQVKGLQKYLNWISRLNISGVISVYNSALFWETLQIPLHSKWASSMIHVYNNKSEDGFDGAILKLCDKHYSERAWLIWRILAWFLGVLTVRQNYSDLSSK